jgi:alcohol dehydrogenase (NADP+)
MIESSDFRTTRMLLNHGAGHIPVLGFGTLIPDAAATISATRDARHFACAERYRNEREVGDALQAGLAAGGIAREAIFVTTKTRQRFNAVVKTGSPGFIPQGR